jgi:histidinol-phosphatase (PHP family)
MAEMIAAARDLGLTGITFTDHAEWYPGDPAYGFLDLDAYFSELAQVREVYDGKMRVLAGIELGNPHDFPTETQVILAHPFDLVIGSVHWLDGLPGWEDLVFRSGLLAAYQLYFEELIQMVNEADFDILGHLDLVQRDSWELFGETITLDVFREPIQVVLRHLIETGRGLEINTSGLRKGLPDPLPGLEVLRWYRDLGGEVLVTGSDSHSPEQIAYGFDTARDIALAAGFHRIARFENRTVVDWIEL